jgi:hypothetical protein
MAVIPPFLQDGVFDQNDIHAMWMALNDVCERLNLPDGQQREAIAARIIDLARRGARRRAALRERVLHKAGQAKRVAKRLAKRLGPDARHGRTRSCSERMT